MNKPETLRRLLEAVLPDIAANPEGLAMFVESGRVAARAGKTLGFEYRYALRIFFADFSGSVDGIVVPLLAWIEQHQPDLLRRADQEPFHYRAELIDAARADVEFTIELTEPVLVRARTDGQAGYEVDHITSSPRLDTVDRFDGVPCDTRLWQLLFGDEIVAQHADG